TPYALPPHRGGIGRLDSPHLSPTERFCAKPQISTAQLCVTRLIAGLLSRKTHDHPSGLVASAVPGARVERLGDLRAPHWLEAAAPTGLGVDRPAAHRRRAPSLCGPAASSASSPLPAGGPSSTWRPASASPTSRRSSPPLPAQSAPGHASRSSSSLTAGWHTSLRLRVPDHVHLLFLPA